MSINMSLFTKIIGYLLIMSVLVQTNDIPHRITTCSCRYKNQTYDLSSLAMANHKARFTFNRGDGYLFSYNPCLPFTLPNQTGSLKPDNCNNVAICYWSNVTSDLHMPYGYQHLGQIHCVITKDGHLALRYKQRKNSKMYSYVELICDKSQTDDNKAFRLKPGTTTEPVFQLTHRSSCPREYPKAKQPHNCLDDIWFWIAAGESSTLALIILVVITITVIYMCKRNYAPDHLDNNERNDENNPLIQDDELGHGIPQNNAEHGVRDQPHDPDDVNRHENLINPPEEFDAQPQVEQRRVDEDQHEPAAAGGEDVNQYNIEDEMPAQPFINPDENGVLHGYLIRPPDEVNGNQHGHAFEGGVEHRGEQAERNNERDLHEHSAAGPSGLRNGEGAHQGQQDQNEHRQGSDQLQPGSNRQDEPGNAEPDRAQPGNQSRQIGPRDGSGDQLPVHPQGQVAPGSHGEQFRLRNGSDPHQEAQRSHIPVERDASDEDSFNIEWMRNRYGSRRGPGSQGVSSHCQQIGPSNDSHEESRSLGEHRESGDVSNLPSSPIERSASDEDSFNNNWRRRHGQAWAPRRGDRISELESDGEQAETDNGSNQASGSTGTS